MSQLPLYILAQHNKLSEHQFMDSQTIDWILKNKPKFNCDQGIKIDPRTIITKYLERYSPSDEWFENKLLISSIHGQRHILRCIALIGILYEANQLSANVDELCMVASLHDIKRENDNEDANHAKKAALWVKENTNLISKAYEYNINETLRNKISVAILYHDKIEYPKSIDCSLVKLINDFKMVDALDRYRQPKIKWWLDENYLESKPNCSIKEIAFELVVRSERYALLGCGNKKSVDKSIYDIS